MEEPQKLTAKLFRFKDPRQERIYRNLLSLVGPGPAAFYQDACSVMDPDARPLLETTTHIVSHLLREIESALRSVLKPNAGSERSKSGNDHQAEIAAILKELEIAETEPIAQIWFSVAGKSEHTLHGRAHRAALTTPRKLDDDFVKFFSDMEAIFDVVLWRLQNHYLKFFPILDTLLLKPAPSEKDINQLRNHVPQNLVTLGYFFDRLNYADWLEPLSTAGYFQRPPEPDYDHEQGTVSFPPWPVSRYLVRMASIAPQDVLSVILQLSPTENIWMHRDLGFVEK